MNCGERDPSSSVTTVGELVHCNDIGLMRTIGRVSADRQAHADHMRALEKTISEASEKLTLARATVTSRTALEIEARRLLRAMLEAEQ